MAFDGAFLSLTIKELMAAVECHVDKIYQPSKDELIFLLRKKGFVKRLLISLKPGAARLHFTENKYENPASPPNFCMLLRKYLSSARLVAIKQPDLERVAELCFSATNELGDIVEISLICELIGNQTNAVLVKDGRILDALRHSQVESGSRFVLPGASYQYPERQNKINPLTLSDTDISKITVDEYNISKNLLSLFDGFSPLVCREIEFDALNGRMTLNGALEKHINILKGNGTPFIVYNTEGVPLEFSYREIAQYGEGYSTKALDSYSLLLDAFYSQREAASRVKAGAADIIKLVNNLVNRTQKRLTLRLEELKKTENRENFRIYGELLKANLHLVKNGAEYALVPDYYDEELREIKIPLNPAISPGKNAEKYFKDYKRSYTAQQALSELIVKDRAELVYFDSVLDSISRCVSLSEISEIRQELLEEGYIKAPRMKKPQKNTVSALLEYKSEEGFKIVVGKNNIQNDYITTKLASKGDMWFHTKNIAGSHVVVFCNGQELSDKTILKAAALAALNSKGAASSSVAVDYTPVKFVKKPKGAKPGMVIYTTNKTVYVTPNKEKAE